MMTSSGEFDPVYIAFEDRGDLTIAEFVIPRLTEEFNLEQLGHELFALVEQYGCRKLVVSLGRVEYLTSSGIGKLITLHRKMHRQGGQVVFCDIQKPVEEILRASKLIGYFRIVENPAAAVESLQGA